MTKFRDRLRAGFTIVEMLTVIAVLGVLITIITSVAQSSVRQARERKAKSLKEVVEAGIATYEAQKNYFPGGRLRQWSENGLDSGKNVDYLTDSEYDEVLREMVKVSIKGSNPTAVFNPWGLTTISSSGANSKTSHGKDLRQAVNDSKKKHGGSFTINSMVYGYPEAEHGYFRRFIIQYNGSAHIAKVLTQGEYQNLTGWTWPQKP